jgi:ribokinase
VILVFGSINIDLVARVTSIPLPGETVRSLGYETLFGGKDANQAIAGVGIVTGSGCNRSLRWG